MPTLRTNIVGSPVIIYDEQGSKLTTSEVISFNKNEMRIEVNLPGTIKTGDVCDILIICPPTPWEYKGRVLGTGPKRELALFHGKTKESRSAQRFKVEFPADISAFICDGQSYKMHSPVTVKVLNISRTGFRFIAGDNTISFGDIFQMSMRISADTEKHLEAEVVNTKAKDNSTTEYGCRFLAEGGGSNE